MADGAAYDININAKANGLSSASSQLTSLADALEIGQAKYNQLEMASTKANQALEKATMAAASVEKLAAAFENASAKASAQASAVESAKSNLAALAAAGDTSAAAMATASAELDAASAKYASLATNAGIAERALAKATKSGAEVGTLTAAAQEAAAAVKNEAVALDKLKASASAAANGQKKLTDATKNLSKDTQEGMRNLKDLGKKAAGPAGEYIEKLSGAMSLMVNPAAAVAVLAGVAAIGMAAMATGAIMGVFALAKLAIQLNKAAKVKFDNIGKKAQENFAKLFSGVKVDKFLDAYRNVTSLLDESSSSAKALKSIIEGILNPLFEGATAVAPIAKELFKGLIVGALILAITVVVLKNALAKMIPEGLLSNVDWLKTAFNAGIIIMLVFAAAVVIATVVFGVLMALIVIGCLMGIAALLAVPIAIILIIAAVLYVASVVGKFFMGMTAGAADAASNIIAGLVNGIKSGTVSVVGAMTSMASAAAAALVNKFKIGSPSKLFFEYGDYTAEGLENGIVKGTPGVTSAMETMATPPDALENGEMAGKKTGGGSSGKSASISGNTFHLYGVKDAADAESRIGAMLTRIIEGDVLQMGGEVPA